jgi:hypothetical protein
LILHHLLGEESFSQWHGSRVTGAWLFVISLEKIPGAGDTAPCNQNKRCEVTVRIEFQHLSSSAITDRGLHIQVGAALPQY